MINFIKKHWLLIFILLLSAFARFYRLPATVTFLEDEGRDVLIEHRLLNGNLTALGPQTSTGNMYLGPFYYYFTAPALWLFGGDPMGPIFLIALSGVLTTYLLYIFVKDWFGQPSAFAASLLFALLPATVYMNRNSWNPNLTPLVTLLYLKVIELCTSRRQYKYFFLLGILGGILVQLHYMVLLLLGVSAIYLLWNFRRQLLFFVKGAIVAFLGFLLPLTPFIIFEIKNNFVNTHAIIKFVTGESEPNIRYSLPFKMYQDKVIETTGRLLSSLFGKGQVTGSDPFTPFFLLSFFILTILALRKSKPVYKMLFFTTWASIALLGIYQENIHLHYLGFLFPLVIILLSATLSDKRKWLLFCSLFYLLTGVFYGGLTTLKYINSGPSSQLTRAKEVANYIVNKAGGRSYNAVTFRDTSTTTPFAYFLAISNNPPKNSLQSTLFLICIDRPCDQSDLDFAWIFRKGPAHPSLTDYLGHPFIADFRQKLVFNQVEHVSHGVWVGEVSVKISP